MIIWQLLSVFWLNFPVFTVYQDDTITIYYGEFILICKEYRIPGNSAGVGYYSTFKCLPKPLDSENCRDLGSLIERRTSSSLLSADVIHTKTQRKLGRRIFILLKLPTHSSPMREAKAGTQAGQEPRGRNWSRLHRGVREQAAWLALSAHMYLMFKTNWLYSQ